MRNYRQTAQNLSVRRSGATEDACESGTVNSLLLAVARQNCRVSGGADDGCREFVAASEALLPDNPL
jgi:hypothetical protein